MPKKRTIEQQIADLEARIQSIRAKADPALKHSHAALAAIEKALAATKPGELRDALGRAKAALAPVLGQEPGRPRAATRRRAASGMDDLEGALLGYLRTNPGQRGEEISAALDLDTKTIRPAMRRLIDAGKVRTEGQRRGMRYEVV